MDPMACMTTFCRVAELKNFSRAARQLGVTPAVASRQVKALEAHLGIRLLNRSTRRVELSEAGERFYPRCLELVEQWSSLENEAGGVGSSPQGLLRVSAPMDFGQLYLREAVREFLSRCPELRLEWLLEDRQVDLIEENIDVAIRIARPRDSNLVARRLGQACVSCYAAPDYLAQHGEPEAPAALADHAVLHYALASRRATWRFSGAEGPVDVAVRWRLAINNGRALADAAARGLGIVQLPEVLVADHVAAGRLVEILPAHRSEPLDISAVFVHRRFRPAKVTAFVEFLVEWFERHPVMPGPGAPAPGGAQA